ncbi:hypothetical protein ACFX2I_033426 [Malus domestica]
MRSINRLEHSIRIKQQTRSFRLAFVALHNILQNFFSKSCIYSLSKETVRGDSAGSIPRRFPATLIPNTFKTGSGNSGRHKLHCLKSSFYLRIITKLQKRMCSIFCSPRWQAVREAHVGFVN